MRRIPWGAQADAFGITSATRTIRPWQGRPGGGLVGGAGKADGRGDAELEDADELDRVGGVAGFFEDAGGRSCQR